METSLSSLYQPHHRLLTSLNQHSRLTTPFTLPSGLGERGKGEASKMSDAIKKIFNRKPFKATAIK